MIIRHNLPFRARFFHSLKGIAALLLVLLAALIASPEPASAQATPTAPGKPTGVIVTPGDTVLTVSWNAPTNDGGSPITGYLVQSLHFVCAGWSFSPVPVVPLNFEVGPSVRSHVITGLRNGDRYCVRVTAVNDEGQSEPAQLFYSVIPTGAPEAPTITSVFVGDGSLNVIWTPPRHDGGEEIESYEVEYKQATEDDTMWTAADDTTSPSLITGLVNGTTYNVRVRAVNAIGGGDWAESDGTPAATSIRTVTADATGDGTADVTVSVDNPDNTTVYIQYRLIGASDTPTTLGPKTATSDSPDVTFNLSGLTPAARYTLRTTLVDGDYTNSPPLVFVTYGEFKQGYFQQTIFPTHGTFWIGTTGVSGSRTIHFRYQVIDSETWITLSPQTITGLEDASFYLTGLESNTRYDIEISTAPSWPSGATISRFFRTVPFKPTGLTLKAGDQRIDATWDSLTELHTPFVVEWKEDGDNWRFGSSRSNYVYGTEYTITGLENGKTYDVHVRSINAGGYSQWSDVESVTLQITDSSALTGISVPDATVTSSGATVTVTLDDAIATLVYLRYKKLSDMSWGSTHPSQPQTGSSLSVDFVLSDLVAGTAYDVEASLDSSGFTNPQTTSFTTLTTLSTDAALSGLTLSGIDFGTFASGTESYTAEVINDPTETTVTPTVNHSGAIYVIKIGGVTDSDGTVPLANGDNLITVEVTAEDRATKKTYTVTVTRLVISEQTEASTDATLSGLILSGVDFGTFTSDAETYTADVAYSVSQTTVTPTLNDSDASYVIGLGGTEAADGTVSLAVGSNVITVEVTAEDDTTEKTYTVTVTRAAASTDATLSGLILSGVDFGTFASDTETYTADVAYSVSQTTVTPTLNDSDASYVIGLGGTEDTDGTVSLAVGSNVITVEVTAEDGTTEKTYTVTVTRAAASTDATLSGLILSDVDFGTFASDTETYTADVAYSVSQTTVTPTLNDSDASYVIGLGGTEDTDGTVSLAVGSNVITIEVTAGDGSTTRTYTVTVARAAPPSSDATLKSLSLSRVSIGAFSSVTTSYAAHVANSVSQTTVTPTVNHSGATYVIKLGGVTDSDHVIPLSVGSNVITVEVTAEDGQTSQTYTVTVTRAAPPSTDATLSALTLSHVEFGTFSPATTSYTAQVANSVTETTVTPTVNDTGARPVIKLGGVIDTDGVVSLAVGANIVTIEVIAEDGETTLTYTVAVTRAEPPSTDATLKALALSKVDFGTFDSTTTSYSASVANSVAETKVSPIVNDSGASYVIKIGGVTDSDGTVPLAVGNNVITVVVTAEDGSTTLTYTVTVTRAEPPSTDATLKGLALSDVNFGTFSSGTVSYTAQVANSVTETTVTPDVNDSGASHVVKLGGVTDADGTVALAVGSNVITVEVTAEDGNTTRTYTVTVTRAESPTPEKSSDATLSALTLSDVNFETFDSTTISYSASVANTVTQTTVTPTVNHSDASSVVKLGGVEKQGTIPLAIGSNVITIEVTAEDGETTKTYTVTVTRSAPPSTDATLSALTLSGVSFGTFTSGTTRYTASVANSVSRTTVTPVVNHSGARYVIKLGGVTDADGTVSLAVGRNVITIVVTAQDGSATRTYTVTVTRSAPLSTDATLSALTLRDVNFGTFDSSTTSYSASVANSISRTTVTPGVSNSGASYVIRLGGVTDSDGTVSLAVGSNVITIVVTAQDGGTTRTYSVTVTRAAQDETPPGSDTPVTGELPTDDPKVNFRVSGYAHDRVGIAWAVPQNRDITGYVVQRYEHNGSGFVSSGSGEGSRFEGATSGGSLHSLSNIHVQPGTLYQYVLALKNDGGTTIIEASSTVRTLSSDATLSALTLSDIDFGAFDPNTTSYTADAEDDVSETTVAPVLNHTGASYVIKLDGTVDEDGNVSLELGENLITVEVTAEDGETALTYTVTITREDHSLLTGELSSDDPPANFRITGYDEDDVNLAWEIPHNRGITNYVLERYDHDGTEFVSSDWSVSGTVAGGDSVTEFSTGLSSDTLYRYDLTLKSDDGTVIIEKSLEVRTHADGASALSADAALSALSLSGVELDSGFSSSTFRYTGGVASDVTQTTVTATPNDSAASYVVKLGGAVDADRAIDLTPGRNVITVHVTAEDGVTTRIYTVIVTRAKVEDALSSDATLRSLSFSGIDIGTFDPDTTTYSAQVTNDVTQTTVTPVRNDVEAAHVIELDGVEDADGVIDLAVGANVITVGVTAEDGETTRTYTVTVTREEAPAPDPEPVDACVQAVGAGGAIEGSWDDTCLSEKDAPGGAGDRYARFYIFTLTEVADVVISLSSDEDTYLYVLDGHGKGGDTLHSNDDIASGGVNLNSLLSVTLQPGIYTIEATTYSPEISGAFTLTIAGLGETEEPAPAPQPDPEPEPEVDGCVESITAGGTIEGSWDGSCLSDRAALSGTGDRYSRFYTFTLDESADVTLLLESDEDTYLYLLEGHGRSETVLHEEDDIDYPSNTNSQLAKTLQAGDYTIEATTYYANKSGEFTLTISGLDSTQ